MEPAQINEEYLNSMSLLQLKELCRRQRRKYSGFSTLAKPRLVQHIIDCNQNNRILTNGNQGEGAEIHQMRQQIQALNVQLREYEESVQQFQEYAFDMYAWNVTISDSGCKDMPEHFASSYMEEKNSECIICYEPLVKGNISITHCGHVYCKGCRSKISECAICRKHLE